MWTRSGSDPLPWCPVRAVPGLLVFTPCTVPRGQLWMHLLGCFCYPAVILFLQLLFVDAEILRPQLIYLSLPCFSPGGTGACERKGLSWRPQRGEHLCWHKWEAAPTTTYKLSKSNRACPAQTIACFLFFPNKRKRAIVVTACSLSEFNNPCLLPFFALLMCMCQQTCSLPVVVLGQTPLAKSPPCSSTSEAHLFLLHIISTIFHPSWRSHFSFKLKF